MRGVYCIACCATAAQLFAASATSDELHTIRGFASAFRRAHARADTRAFEPLICPSGVQRWAIDDLLHQFGRRFSYRIVRVIPQPFTPSPEDQRTRWNLHPTHRLVVWYSLSRRQPPFPEFHVIGRVAGQYQFGLATNRVQVPHTFVERSNQTMQLAAPRCVPR